MKFDLKKLSTASYLHLISAVLALAAMVVAIVSCTQIPMPVLPLVIVLTVAAIALTLGTVVIANKKGDGLLPSILMVLSVAAIAFAIYQMVMGKSDVFGTIIFSDLEKGYMPAEHATWTGVASIVVYIASAVASIVASFFKVEKK